MEGELGVLLVACALGVVRPRALPRVVTRTTLARKGRTVENLPPPAPPPPHRTSVPHDVRDDASVPNVAHVARAKETHAMFAQVGLTPGHETGRRRVDTRARRSGEKAGDVRKKSTSFGLRESALRFALCSATGGVASRSNPYSRVDPRQTTAQKASFETNSLS